MKKFTKLLGIVLIMALVMSMGISSAFAASIKITHQDGSTPDTNTKEETYNYYKIFSATVPSGHKITDEGKDPDEKIGDAIDTSVSGFQYKLSSKTDKWYTAVNACGYFDLSEQEDGTVIATLKKSYTANADTAKAIAAALLAYTTDGNGTIAPDGTLTPGTAKTVDDGYYLIYSSLGENLVLATSDIEIKEKNYFPSIDKEEKDEDKTAFIDKTLTVHNAVGVAVGDEIDYQVTVTIPSSANQDVVVNDTMSTGLTLVIPEDESGNKLSALAITPALTADVAADAEAGTEAVEKDYVINSETASGWKVTFHANANTKGKSFVITFKATVNESAIVTDTDKKNEVTLDYSEFSQYDYVPYEMKAAGIYKFDGNTKEPLAGVKFTITENGNPFYVKKVGSYYVPTTFTATAVDTEGKTDEEIAAATEAAKKAEEAARTVVTDANGKIVIRGLDGDKTYVLTETETVTGYNKLTDPVTLTLKEDTGATDFDPAANTLDQVENNKGTQLPSTGGIGTTIFYVVGSILVVAAGVLLITKKRMSREG